MPIIRPSIKQLIYCVFLGYASLLYFFNYPIVSFFSKLLVLLSTFFIVLNAWCIGSWFMSFFSLDVKSRLEKSVFAVGLGYGLISSIVFICGILHILYIPVLTGILIIIPILLIPHVKTLLMNIREIRIPLLNPIQYILSLLICIFLSLSFIVSFAPPTYYDSLVYHLALPAIYLREHSLYPVSYNLFSYFPASMEMLYTCALAIGGDIAANFISWSTIIIAFLSCWILLRKYVSLTYALIGALLFVSSPSVMLLGSGAYVEMGLTMFTILSVLSFNYWIEKRKTDYLLLSAIFGGYAIGTKYIGGITFIILFIVLIVYIGIHRMSLKEGLKNTGLFFGVSSLAASPWLLKNALTIGNPVFPFFYNIFGWGNIAWTGESARGYFTNFVEYGIKKNVIYDILNILSNPGINLVKYGGGFDILGTFGWTLPFLLLFLILFIPRKKKIFFLIFYVCLHLLMWGMTGQVLRFLLPLFPIIIVIGVVAMSSFMKDASFFVRYFFTAFFGLYIVSNAFMFFFVQSIIQPWNVALGIEHRDNYLTKIFPDYYPAMMFINNNIPRDAKVYLFGDQRGYYCNRTYESTCAFAPERLVAWAHESHDVPSFVNLLRDNHFTHIFYNMREAERLRPYGILNFSEHGKKIWDEALKQLTLLYSDSFSAVYEIPPY